MAKEFPIVALRLALQSLTRPEPEPEPLDLNPLLDRMDVIAHALDTLTRRPTISPS